MSAIPLIAICVAVSAVVFMTIHNITEGHRGVYFRGGALLNVVTKILSINLNFKS